MALENDDPFSQLSQQGGANPNTGKTSSDANDHHDNIHLLNEDHPSLADPEHSHSYEHDYHSKSGGHFSGEEEDPEKDALVQYSKTVGGWWLADDDSGASKTTNNNKNNQSNQNNQNNQNNNNQNNNLNAIQQEQLRHQQNMNRMEETNKGLQTSKNMISTFQENAEVAMGFNPNIHDIIKETQGELRDYLLNVQEELLDESKTRVKATKEENDEAFLKLNWLKVKINQDKVRYRKYEDKSRRWALIFRLMSSMLAAIVTVLLGLNITDYMKSLGIDWFVNFFALLISAFISIIGVIQGFFDANELFIKYTDTANKLEELEEMIEYLELSRDYVSLRQVNLILRAYSKIVNSTHDYEMRVRAEGEDKKR
jgi:hypothetical protein